MSAHERKQDHPAGGRQLARTGSQSGLAAAPDAPTADKAAMRTHHTTSQTRQTRVARLIGVAIVTAIALAAPFSATASPVETRTAKRAVRAHLPTSLQRAATKQPQARFRVIVQASGATESNELARKVEALTASSKRAVSRRFRALEGVAATLTGRQLVALSKRRGIRAITLDNPVRLASSTQQWPYTANVDNSWPGGSLAVGQAPTIAIIDSGVDTSRPDIAGRVLTQVEMVTTGGANSPGDGRGHGTFVASIAAGSAAGYFGVAPTAKLVSVDVADDSGVARTSDVIAAADWVLANKNAYGIKVANLSLHSVSPGTFMYDPLNKAVERLWFSGIVVVAAAGNYAQNGNVSGIPYAPANDPFVITVGAADIAGSMGMSDDFNAPWSAYGYTLDGFAKPEVGAPGRYMVGAVPPNATPPLERPTSVTAPGYMQLSGTSFAAPVVAGMAAQLLALRPNYTPDQVKGALMATAKRTSAAPSSIGLGEVKLTSAYGIVDPPNPNLALRKFVVADPAGGSLPVFDAEAWKSAASGSDAWDAASWTSASWTSASWTSASWTSASWTSASWTSASWTSAAASWTSASWMSGSHTNASWTSQSDASALSNADTDVASTGGYVLTAAELAAAAAAGDEEDVSTGTVVGADSSAASTGVADSLSGSG